MVKTIIKPIRGKVTDNLIPFDLEGQAIPAPGTALAILGFEPTRC
jgi:hypothetical protein